MLLQRDRSEAADSIEPTQRDGWACKEPRDRTRRDFAVFS